METPEKIWYVNIDGTIHEASRETVDQWIWDGTILSHHTVSRGGLRWLEAGRAPQFAQHFSPTANSSLKEEEIDPGPTFDAPLEPITGDDHPTPLGLRISMGSAIALAVALLAGYLWAFQISSPHSRATLMESPEIRALQLKYATEKKKIEDIRYAQKAEAESAPAPALTRNPESGLNCSETSDINKGGNGLSNKCAESDEKWREGQEASLKKIKAAVQDKVAFDMNGLIITNVDKSLETLDLKLEADQKQTILDLQKADARSRFYRTFIVLFLGLAGLNIVRLTLLPLKRSSLPAGPMSSVSAKS